MNPPSPKFTDVERRYAEALALQELSPLAHIVLRARFAVASAVGLLSLTLWLLGADVWRVVVLVATAAALLAVNVAEVWILGRKRLTAAQIAIRLGVVFAAHTSLILVSGGVESPLLFVYVPVAALLAAAVGRPRLYAWGVSLPLVTVAVLAFGRSFWQWPSLLPEVFVDDDTGALSTAWRLTAAAAVVGAIVLVGAAALRLRRSLDDAIASALRARAETLHTIQEQNRELLALIGNMAHELKNPLASIQGLTQLVERKLPADSREAEQLGVVRSEVLRLGNILEEHLNLSRPMHPLSLRPVGARSLLHSVAALFQATVEHGREPLLVEADDALVLHCDPRKVQQVLLNLVQNAMEASPEGERVELRARASDSGVEFTVLDYGSGLPTEERARLFSVGYTTKPDGSGFGLPIARLIAEQHGGRLTLEPALDGGSVAALWLPLWPPQPEHGAA